MQYNIYRITTPFHYFEYTATDEYFGSNINMDALVACKEYVFLIGYECDDASTCSTHLIKARDASSVLSREYVYHPDDLTLVVSGVSDATRIPFGMPMEDVLATFRK